MTGPRMLRVDPWHLVIAGALPGDVVLLWRRGTWREWIRRPVSSAISWRIRRATTTAEMRARGVTPPNHVALLVDLDHRVLEAEFDRTEGVGFAELRDKYPLQRFDAKVARLPDRYDRGAVIAQANIIARTARGYDLRYIAFMRLAVALFGVDGLRNVRAPRDDGRYICSELCADAWAHGGFTEALDELVTPGDFLRFVET